MGRVAATPKSFIERKRPIDPLRRKLAKLSGAAIDVLEETMNNAANTPKVRADAASTLLSTYKSVLTIDTDDKLRRMELQIKHYDDMYKLGASTAAPEDDEDDDTPLLDFDNIADVE